MTSYTRSVVVLGALLLPGTSLAQTVPPAVTTAPLNILVPNYNSVAAGEIGSLEANAFLARANDLFIAAHARSLGLTLVTNNTAEFARVKGLRVENWTQPPRRIR